MSQLTWLNPHSLRFPPLEQALEDPNGLLALGGDLSPARLESAYRSGIFPWYQDGQPILWWSPDPRTVLFPDQLHISRSMQKFLRKTKLHVSFDAAFEQVIKACAAPRDYTDDTWITEEMQAAYVTLHAQGLAHSVEVWDEGELVGGLYGIAIGRVFFGESMFSQRDNASKTGFIRLVRHLAELGFVMIDCQMPTDHLFSLGAVTLPRREFQARLAEFCHAGVVNHWAAL